MYRCSREISLKETRVKHLALSNNNLKESSMTKDGGGADAMICHVRKLCVEAEEALGMLASLTRRVIAFASFSGLEMASLVYVYKFMVG